MKLVSALVGLTALGGVALSSVSASAMPVTIPGQAPQASNVEQADGAIAGTGRVTVTAITTRTIGVVTTARIIGAVGAGTPAGDTGTGGITGTSGNPEKGASAPFFLCRPPLKSAHCMMNIL